MFSRSVCMGREKHNHQMRHGATCEHCARCKRTVNKGIARQHTTQHHAPHTTIGQRQTSTVTTHKCSKSQRQVQPNKIDGFANKIIGLPTKIIGLPIKIIGLPINIIGLPTILIGLPTILIGFAGLIVNVVRRYVNLL